MLSRFRRALLPVLCVVSLVSGYAQQAPIPLPNTVSTYGGGGTTAYSAGTACYPGATTTATDTLGDGCPATLANFNLERGGVVASPTGDIFVMDTTNMALRVINARSGLVQLVAGKGTICSTSAGRTDSNGDGCPLANTLFTNSGPRGIGTDPYGNVIVAGYNTNLVNLVCQAVSPLCPNTAGTHQIGYMYLIAGCVIGTGSAGTSGNGADGGTATPTGTCSTSVAELGSPRGVGADTYGNVFIADTANFRFRVVLGPATYNGVTNPWFALIQANPTYASATIAAGNIYPLLGNFTTTPANGAPCTSGSSTNSLDAIGDGCPYYVGGLSTTGTSTVNTITADLNGNVILTDLQNARLRVIYMGGAAMANAITVNNPAVTSPVVGSIYSLAGGGTTTTTTSPLLGNKASIDGNAFKVTTDNNGNIYIGDNTVVLFYDINTGYIRRLVTNGSGCTAQTDSIYDGCSATQASFGSSAGLGVAVNAQGDLFIADTNNNRVRRVAATSLLPTAVNATSTQTLVLHGAAGTTAITPSLLNSNAGNPIAFGTPSCGAANSDNTLECTVPVTFSPTTAGAHSTAATATSTGVTATALLQLSGNASGPAMAFDLTSSSATAATIGSGLKPAALAIDSQGNLYTYNVTTSALTKVSPSGTATQLPGALLAAPTQIAVDALGNVYAVGDGSANIWMISLGSNGSYTAGTISFLPNGNAGLPQAIAVDAGRNLYVYDGTSKAIYRVTQSSPGVLTAPIFASTVTFSPTGINSLAMDPEGDLYISDSGAQKLYFLAGNKSFPWAAAPTALATSSTSAGLAVDNAGDVYTADVGSLSVLMYSLSGQTVTSYAGLTTPNGVAIDTAGNVYIADSSQTGILMVSRSAATLPFGTSTTNSLGGFLTNIGNVTGTGLAQTDSADFQVVAGTTNGCNVAGTVFGPGSACSISATFTPQAGTGNVSDQVTFIPAASSSGLVSVTGTKSGSAVTTTTTIGGQTPGSPTYSASATEATFTVTVGASAGTASGSVSVTVDANTPASYTLDGTGKATVALSGLTAGTHTISASYGSQNGFTGSSTASATSFTVGQAGVTVSWTPGALTQQFSQPIGLSVLNATAVISGTSTAAPGSFIYSVTPSGGSAISADASTYLPIGTYSMNVTFVPTDSTDYAGGTASVASYTVTKASTTAAIGGTQNLVAADGSGNFSSIQSVLNTLPTTGGSIYIKPGTYTGFITVNLPNVSLRGLGGDPTQVILTNEQGAFSSPYLAGQSAGNNGSMGDQGSATLVVAKGTVNGVTATPNNFYMEGVTVNNTYDTDTTNSNSVGTIANVCQTITPTNNFALYNGANTSVSPGLCNSQALAMWITSDEAVLNNIRLNSLQDTLYAGSQGCGATCTVARQYYWRGKITGDVDFIFGDAAAVFDHTNVYTVWHGATATGTETIEAQNKRFQTGSAGDYLSGYVFNRATFTSQSTGMTALYYGRPYGQFSTNIILNSYVDQVNPVGYIEFSGDTNLPTSTYAEFNTTPYIDPTPGQADLDGVIYTGSGGNTGAGVTGTREITSIQPTTFTAAQAAPWFPINFLGNTVSGAALSAGQSATWDPTAALASGANAFVPTASPTTVNGGTVFTLLMRPQTPGAGTIPTGTWTLLDGPTQVATGTLDASGQAYYSTKTLSGGQHSFTWSYGGDTNFSGSTSSTPYVVNVTVVKMTSLMTVQPPASVAYGSTASIAVMVAASGGTPIPTGQVSLSVDGSAAINGTLSGAGSYTFAVSGLSAGLHSLAVSYAGDSSFNSSGVNSSVTVTKAVLQVIANNFTIAAGATVPTYTASYNGFVGSDTQAVLSGSPALTTNPATPVSPGSYTITSAVGTLATANYNFSFINGTLVIQPSIGLTAVATGDTRTVTEPSFPSVCAQITAALTSVNDDIPTSVDAANTNPDGSRIQAALNSCANSSQAVELSVDSSGHNAFLTGPINMPSGVTLLVDPGVTVYFSRNVQDYDIVSGTHTCGTVNSNSATGSCLPLINIKNVSNVGIMGYGKLDGRGGDVLLNPFPSSYIGQSWWGLSAIANSGGSQQNPRFIQMGGSTNVTLYKITLRNSPLFHVSTTSTMSNVTVWDIKVITPTSARNTDGIDPGNATNFTITKSWVSDGDDDVAVGASGSSGSANISVTNNHFFAGHGESIGSYTSGGVNNVLFDGNMLAGNSSVDSNSTGLRIKSANDRGGLVQNIQYSNSCFQNHKSEIQFTPIYNTNTGTATPNFKNLLLQNLTFLTEGTVQFTGANNNGTINPLIATLDNVSFATLSASDFNAAPTNAQLTYGPGQVSSNFVSAYATFVGGNGNAVIDNRTATSLLPPACNFTFIAPELTGPAGVPQTITAGQTATAVVILTPAVGGSTYPTGTVTLTDQTTATTYTASLTGSSDTLFVPLPGLSVGTHTFIATYGGNTNYVPTVPGTPYSTTNTYNIIVYNGNLGSSTTTLSGVANSTFGNAFTVTATVIGTAPTGAVQFTVNGAVTSSSVVGGNGVATASLNLPVGNYTIQAIYGGDGANAGSSSAPTSFTVAPAATTIMLSANNTTTTLGVPIRFTATVASVAGTPSGTVTFTYTTATNSTPTTLLNATLTGGIASASANLPIGTDTVTATYNASGSFASSVSSTITVTVNPPVAIPLSPSPIALPYTISTIAGGATASNANTACSGSTDSFGNGCAATAINLTSSALDLRSVVADSFGNVYFTDANASQVRRIAPNGVVSLFAGYVSGTACTPTATATCIPTLVKLNKARGISSDPAGNIYIAGYSDNKVYKVSVTTGMLSLIAGTGTKPSDPTQANGDGSAATSALLNGPRGVWADAVGNVYIADTTDNKIRVVDLSGNIQTVAGTGATASSGDGGPANQAAVNNPQAVLTDPSGNVYISEASRIRVVCVTCTAGSGLYQLLNQVGVATPQNGYIYTVAGGGTASYSAPVLASTISISPQKLAIDAGGNIYAADGGGAIWFIDSRTAYLRRIAGEATTSTTCNPTASPNIGDGCPATQAIIGNAGNGIGVGTDTQGNIYISDTLNARIRKVSTNLALGSSVTGMPVSSTLDVHFITGDVPQTAGGSAITVGGSEYVAGALTCSANADTTIDCIVPLTFTPAVPGFRTAPVTITAANGDSAQLGFTGIGTGAGITVDPASQITFGSSLQVNGIAVDSARNVYVSDGTSKRLLKYLVAAQSQGSAASFVALATLTNPGPVAVDSRNYIYVADISTGQITQVSPTGAITPLPYKFITPAGMTVDALNNLYVSDSTAATVYQLNPGTGAQKTLSITGLVAPQGLTIDPNGNLIIADPGAAAVLSFNINKSVITTLTTTAAKPSGIAEDAAGNLIIADVGSILANPASSNSAAFTISNVTPTALALNSAGDIYTNSGSGSVLMLQRTNGSIAFSSPTAAAQSFYLLSTGNQALNITAFNQSDSADFTPTFAPSTDCVLSGTAVALPVGGACAGTAGFVPITYGSPVDTIVAASNATNAALSNPATNQLVLSGSNPAPATATILGVFQPASPIYGQPVTLTVTITSTAGTPTGSVNLTVDGNTTSATLNNGVATFTFSNLVAGTNSISARYPGAASFAASSANPVTLTVGKATPTLTTSANPTTINSGASITLTATVVSAAGSPTGTVQFYNGALALGSPATISSGKATLTTTALTVGNDSISAVYSGDTNFITVTSASNTVTVSKGIPTVTVTASPTSINAGGSVTLTATIAASNGTPTGTVQFYNGATVLGLPATISSGKASLTTATLPVGSDSISAVYSGDTNFVTVTSTSTTVTVSKSTPTVAVAANPTSINVGGSVTLTATVSSSAGTPTGTVQFYNGTTTLGSPANLSGGIASLTTTTLPAGNNSVTAVYSGDGNFVSVTSAALAVSVKVATTLSLAVSPAIPAGGLPQGTSDTFTATLAGALTPTGTVTFYDGTTAISSAVSLSSGAATFTPTAIFAVGSHSITATYSGDGLNQAATSAAISFTSLSSTAPGFSFSSTVPSTITVPAGGSTTITIPINPNPLYAGTISFACTDNPATLTCAFNPPSLTFTLGNSTPQSTVLTLSAAAGSARLDQPANARTAISLAAILGLPWLLLAGSRRSLLRKRYLVTLLLTAVATLGIVGVTGCGTTHSQIHPYSLVITANDGTNTRTIPISVDVTH